MIVRGRHLLTAGVLVLCIPTSAVAGSSGDLQAKLTPIAPARASGSFTASGAVSKNTVHLTWRWSLSHLSGPATKATLRLPGLGNLTFVLCKPCSSSGRGTVGLVSSVWENIVANGAQIVVATRAHPAGELRGTLRRR